MISVLKHTLVPKIPRNYKKWLENIYIIYNDHNNTGSGRNSSVPACPIVVALLAHNIKSVPKSEYPSAQKLSTHRRLLKRTYGR